MLQKVHLKLLDRHNQSKWVHFCYISEDVKKRFIKACPKMSINIKIRHWANDDFGAVFLVDDNDLSNLKMLIKAKYKHKYPELFRELSDKTDRQGWIAIWLTEHMEKEITAECLK